jgi:hypothetical protein
MSVLMSVAQYVATIPAATKTAVIAYITSELCSLTTGQDWETEVLPTLSYKQIVTFIWSSSVADNLNYNVDTIKVIENAVNVLLAKQKVVSIVFDYVIDTILLSNVLSCLCSWKAGTMGQAAINVVAIQYRTPLECASLGI